MKLTILGPGLLGASIAQAFSKRAAVSAWSRTPEIRAKCHQQPWCATVADTPGEAVKGADVVILCTSVASIPTLCKNIAPHLDTGTLVTDVGSTKNRICNQCTALMPKGTSFIGSHPMAGSEKAGMEHAHPDLFRDQTCFVTPLPETDPDKLKQLTTLWKTLGMHVTLLSPEVHDAIVARISHLPHLLAACLCRYLSTCDPQWTAFGGKGLRDTTRIASGSPLLWRDIFEHNREQVLQALKAFKTELLRFESALKEDAPAQMLTLLEQGKAYRDALITRSDTYPLPPFTRPANGSVPLPGSKSLTNRALLLAALSKQTVRLEKVLFSDDTRILITALQALGFSIEIKEANCTVILTGENGHIPRSTATIQVGNAGTVARFLTAFLALHPNGTYTLDGSRAMRKRPIKGLLDALTTLGATVEYHGELGAFPFTLRTSGLRGRDVWVQTRDSSQLLSALLMVAPHIDTQGVPDFVIRLKDEPISKPFIPMTLELMRQFGYTYRVPDARTYSITPINKEDQGKARSTLTYTVEADATAASYFLALPIVMGGTLDLPAFKPDGLQGDVQFAELLQQADLLDIQPLKDGGIRASKGTGSRGITHDFNAISDTFLTLAALAPLLKGPTHISGIAHTRRQETDRVAAVARELRRLGQEVHETEGTLEIHPCPLRPATIRTYGDHRMAMSFGILGCYDLHGNGTHWLTLEQPDCCAKTFPDFFTLLESLRQRSLWPFILIAIDGTAASGKSSTARALAATFHFLHADTGTYYRALTAALLEAGLSPTDEAAITANLKTLTLTTHVADREAQIQINGHVPKDAALGTPSVNAHVALFAALKVIRTRLLDFQRSQSQVARQHGFRGLIMEGRDIGSVVLPQADFRFFLAAHPETQACRRRQEGQTDPIQQRDQLDQARKHAPLRCPENAIRIDTNRLTLEEVVAYISTSIQNGLL